MTATVPREPIAATTNDHALSRLEQQLSEGVIHVTDVNGESVELPEELCDLLRRGIHELRRGNRVSLLSFGRLLTTQQAAELLGMSRPYLVRLLERGDLPYERVGTHRRLLLDDVLAYRRRRSDHRRSVLRELSRDADDLGIYTE
jgi:excisionase family DNA binding protein